GRDLASRLGQHLVSSTLELSGCDAMFVLEDADVPFAAKAAWFGVTLNRGQTCLAVKRIFVHRSLYQDFQNALGFYAQDARPVKLALASQAIQAGQLLRDAIQQGGKLLKEPASLPDETTGRDCCPLVVVDAHPEMDLCKEASFAPIAAVIPFDNLEQAAEWDA